jgi:uncharacterized protein (TIGR02266 family)
VSVSSPPTPSGSVPAAPRSLRPQETPTDERAHARLPFEVHVHTLSDHNFYAGLTLNVSDGGLFVATHIHHPVGTRLEIRLMFPGDEQPTSLLTEVRWVRLLRDAGDSSPGMGLRFIDPPQSLLDKVGRFAKNRDPLYYDDD